MGSPLFIIMAKQSKRCGKYRSQLEAMIALNLSRKKIKFKFEESKLSYTCWYIPDFELPNGIIVEAKGYLDAKDRSKMISVKKDHPDLDIRFCFQNAKNKLGKGSKTTYAEWAQKHGFPWCEKIIPQEWVEE